MSVCQVPSACKTCYNISMSIVESELTLTPRQIDLHETLNIGVSTFADAAKALRVAGSVEYNLRRRSHKRYPESYVEIVSYTHGFSEQNPSPPPIYDRRRTIYFKALDDRSFQDDLIRVGVLQREPIDLKKTYRVTPKGQASNKLLAFMHSNENFGRLIKAPVVIRAVFGGNFTFTEIPTYESSQSAEPFKEYQGFYAHLGVTASDAKQYLGGMRIHFNNEAIYVGLRDFPFSMLEYTLLHFFYQHKNMTGFSTYALANYLYGEEEVYRHKKYAGYNTRKVIYQLRERLGRTSARISIANVHGGYHLDMDSKA